MPGDDRNVGHIEPQDALDALPAALEEGARETLGDSNDNGNGEQAPAAEREVDRMLREWRAEADATRDWPTRAATASRCSAISHARSARRRAKPCSPMSRASPAKPFRHLLPLFLDAPIGEPYLEPVLSVGIERIHFGQRQTLEIFPPPDADWSCPPRRPRRLSCRRSNAAGCRT